MMYRALTDCAQGRQHNDRMKAAHAQAASRMFQERNKHLPAGTGI